MVIFFVLNLGVNLMVEFQLWVCCVFCRAAAIPRAKGGSVLQMKLVYSHLAPLFLLFLEWMDCSCAYFLHRYLSLFHILIYKVSSWVDEWRSSTIILHSQFNSIHTKTEIGWEEREMSDMINDVIGNAVRDKKKKWVEMRWKGKSVWMNHLLRSSIILVLVTVHWRNLVLSCSISVLLWVC